jgi:hypothetical protein
MTRGELMNQALGFQEIPRRLAIVHEGFVQEKARLGLDLARASALVVNLFRPRGGP